jgi:phosphoglucomutase
VREKDGVWAVLLWLNILAVKKQPMADLMAAHWAKFGRNYYTRHDYEAVDKSVADAMVAELRDGLSDLPGQPAGDLTIETADEFAYTDPIDGSVSEGQGLRFGLSGGGRIVIRLSGTGTVGATVRVYLERLETDPDKLALDPQDALASIVKAAEIITALKARTGRDGPDVIT